MSERQAKYNVNLLTPCFCKIGDNKPEIRGSSIRGMIREWKRLVDGSPDNIWGGKGGLASKVGIDIMDIVTTKENSLLLPHKKNPKQQALKDGSSFKLVINRLVGCSATNWSEAKMDVERWLILGCLGQRANRAAGSVWCDALGINSLDKLKFFISGIRGEVYISSSFDNHLIARETASDTVNNIKYFGSFKPRTPSPIKMKVIEFSNQDYRILFYSEKRDLVESGFRLLQEKPDNHRWSDVTLTKVI